MKFANIICAAVSAISISASASTTDDIALTLWAEARGEGDVGRRLVASVIWNRADGKASKLSAVVKAPKQFSCWNNGRIPTVVLNNANDEAIWADCKAIATEMANGSFKPTTSATHYCVTRINPSWAKKMKLVKTYKNHKFFV